MRLRPYQSRAVQETRAALARHRAVILCLPTGAGKTVIACEAIRLALQRARRCLFLVHRIELVTQAQDRLAAFGIPSGAIKAGLPEDRALPVQVASIQTLARREPPPADLVILDECHHAVSDSWARALARYPRAHVLGITATPARLDGKPLGGVFKAIVDPVPVQELIDDGYLIDPEVFAPPVDLSGVHTRGGDYATLELAERVAPLCGDTVRTWAERARALRTVAFAVSVDHSRILEEAFRSAGASVAHIDAKTPADERASAGSRLRDGDLNVVTQVGIWTEGVDIPELECLVVARPTKSLSLHRQMIGRVMRPAPGKSRALVLDHAGNHHTHGPITEPVEWSLSGRVRRPSTAASVSTCQECFAVFASGTPACPACGSTREPKPIEPPRVENPGDLVRFTQDDKRTGYRALVGTASARGYRLAWARLAYRERFGVWPRFRDIEKSLYRCRGHEWETKQFGPRTVQRCRRCYEENRHARTGSD